jgi:hypothetical protein
MCVHFSSKITNSILIYLEREGEDLGPLLEQALLEEEFLRDPSYWMSDHEMEDFLDLVQDDLLVKIGHLSPELRSWGVLDSVLRMMPRPQEVFLQPDRFMSYFLNPVFETHSLQKFESALTFTCAIDLESFPLCRTYLVSAFESLPRFVGQNFAVVKWESHQFLMDWSNKQGVIFELTDSDRQLSPELLNSVVASLEKHQLELEVKNRELQTANEQLLKSLRLSHKGESFNPQSLELLNQKVSRIHDYMVRAQQLITMLISQDRTNPAVKAAMRKVDWEKVKEQFPIALTELRDLLNKENIGDRDDENQGRLFN